MYWHILIVRLRFLSVGEANFSSKADRNFSRISCSFSSVEAEAIRNSSFEMRLYSRSDGDCVDAMIRVCGRDDHIISVDR